MLLVPGFAIPEDIVNRALQHVGAERIVTLADNSKNANECAFVYHRLRQAELRRNNWDFAIKRRMLYAITLTTMAWTPPTYNPATTYPVGAVVAYDDTYGARLYLSNKAGNVGNTPGTDDGWEDYFGQVTPDIWASGQSYWAGDVIIAPATVNAGSLVVGVGYTIATLGTSDFTLVGAAFNTVGTQFIATGVGAGTGTVTGAGTVPYISLLNSNQNALTVPGAWVAVNGTLAPLELIYPVGAGPTIQSGTDNVFPLPYGFLRKVNQAPHVGQTSIWGAPSATMITDWLIEGRYMIAPDTGPITFRFVADVTWVPMMDPMFCEGFAARIALEVCEELTQSTEKLTKCAGMYRGAIIEARLVNGIEAGPEQSPEDDFVTCRL
jgi:hypothetical protein